MGKFNEMFKDKNFDYVSVRLKAKIGDDIEDFFAGSFRWENNELTSLDGDCYNPEMEVLEFEEFVNEEDGVKHGLTIVVEHGFTIIVEDF